MPSLFNKKFPEEQIISFEILPVSDQSNIITQTKQKEDPIKHEDSKKSEQSKFKAEASQAVSQEKNAKAREIETIEEKKTIKESNTKEAKETFLERKEEVAKAKLKEEWGKKQVQQVRKPEVNKDNKKLLEINKEVKHKKHKTDELDSLLKNLEQSSEGDNVKSNKYNRLKKVDNLKEAKGVYTDMLPLSDSETSLIKRQIERHWINIPAGVRGNNKVKIIISITLNKAGNVDQVRVKAKICPNIQSSICEALVDNVMRAVWQASPIENLDPARFNHWKEINFIFDPSKL
ncbi:Guanosine polyphosphate pyrophosphohydrolase/synthetase [Rickettsia prowazekii str. Breinl]|nr:Guanosine polyphosphate pyrophosphohydrolase/synthetase [Rickettsia prowazekii str. Breinl]EOB09668.1 Periplasmic protein TonB [Rickettsia prowazekii str. GvF12]EOB10426.1 Transport protein [Rickettsia prowazekii str. Cairo 3]